MFISYGNYTITFSIASSPTNDAAFLTDSSAMNNGRSHDGCLIRWCSGAQTTSTTVTITCTITSTLDATPAIGAVGLVNVQGLPLGTKVSVQGITQRLVSGPAFEELCAWTIPFRYSATQTIVISNDVNGAATIAASTPFAIGEISIGRLLALPVLANRQPNTATFDPVAIAQTAGGADWQTFRMPRRIVRKPLGIFTRADVYGAALRSSILSGAASSGKIGLKEFVRLLSTQQTMAMCDIPNIIPSGGSVSNGFRFDQNDMQSNWMLCRATNLDSLVEDQSPYYSWNPTFSESR